MQAQIYRLHLNGELPKIGSGRRLVRAEIGRKWVRLRAVGSGKRARLTVAAWETLKPVHYEASA